MNLKEAFQAQNKLDDLFVYADSYLGNLNNVTVTKEKHFRSKAAKGQQDEELDVTDYDEKKFPAEKVIDFLFVLIDERKKLSSAIDAAKAAMDFPIDAAVDLNKKRHFAAGILRGLRQIQSTKVVRKNGGVGFVFNNEGNQTEYRYDLELIRTIDFDRNRVRSSLQKLQKEADEISTKIDAALIGTQVDYEYPFDLHASEVEVLEEYSMQK